MDFTPGTKRECNDHQIPETGGWLLKRKADVNAYEQA